MNCAKCGKEIPSTFVGSDQSLINFVCAECNKPPASTGASWTCHRCYHVWSPHTVGCPVCNEPDQIKTWLKEEHARLIARYEAMGKARRGEYERWLAGTGPEAPKSHETRIAEAQEKGRRTLTGLIPE